MTGRMGSNDDAVEWLKDRAPPGLDVALDRARRSTAAAPPPIPDALFAVAHARCRGRSQPAPR